MRHLPPYREHENAADELRATAWRLIVVFALTVAVALASRLAYGPPLF